MSPTPSATRTMRLRRGIRQLHRWVGLLIAIQILFWVCGGLIMSALRLDAVRGDTQAAKRSPTALTVAGTLPITEVLAAFPGEAVTAVTLSTLLERPVYRLESSSGPILVDATSGRVLSPLSVDMATTIARTDYTGPGPFLGMDWVDTPELEFRGRDVPLWRARFDDDRHTAIYVSPATGQVVARRNDLWRVFDFVWMLHIMDYEEREDFNHPLLIVTAATALLFVVTGMFMLFFSFKPRPRPGV